MNYEENLLYYSFQNADIDEVVNITEKAYVFISVLWTDLLKRCEVTDEDTINEWAFSHKDYQE